MTNSIKHIRITSGCVNWEIQDGYQDSDQDVWWNQWMITFVRLPKGQTIGFDVWVDLCNEIASDVSKTEANHQNGLQNGLQTPINRMIGCTRSF